MASRSLGTMIATLAATNAMRNVRPRGVGPPDVDRDKGAELTQMMINVVEHRDGTVAQIPGISVTGKTGTAQPGMRNELPHARFVCFSVRSGLLPSRSPS